MNKRLLIGLTLVCIVITLFFVGNTYSQNTSPNSNTNQTVNNDQYNQNHTQIIDKWILPITKVLTLVSVIVGIFISIQQYRLKVKAEIRLKESANAENDVKLLKIFTEILDIAHGRKNQIISETIVKELFNHNIFGEGELHNLEEINRKIENTANLPVHVGLGAQEAAIVAIANLSIKYKILKEPGLAGLRIIQGFKPEPTTEQIERIINAENLKNKAVNTR